MLVFGPVSRTKKRSVMCLKSLNWGTMHIDLERASMEFLTRSFPIRSKLWNGQLQNFSQLLCLVTVASLFFLCLVFSNSKG